MASLNPQTLYNETTPIYVPNPIKPSGLLFTCSTIGGPNVTLVNTNGVLESFTDGSNATILNTSLWSEFPASTGYIDMAPGGLQRITATNSQLFYNGQALASGGNVADWSYYPVDSGHIDFTANGSQRLTATSSFLVYNGIPITGGSTDLWSAFPALNNVNIANYNLDNCANIYARTLQNIGSNALTVQANSGGGGGRDINLNATKNINLNADSSVNIATPQTKITAGFLSRPDIIGLVDIVAEDGLYGRINLTANPGFTPIANYGRIYITANGGTDPTETVGYGGDIEIVANTPLTVPSATSAVKVNASCVLSYAGFVPIIASIAGVNFVYGSAGVSITSDILGPLTGPVPGCVYLRGRFGTQIETSIDPFGNRYGLYCCDIQPFADVLGATTDMTIKGRGAYFGEPLIGNVQMSNVKTIDGNIYVYDPTIAPTEVILQPRLEILGLSTINGFRYTPIGSANINFGGYSIENCSTVNASTIRVGLVSTPTVRAGSVVSGSIGTGTLQVNTIATSVSLGGNAISNCATLTATLINNRILSTSTVRASTITSAIIGNTELNTRNVLASTITTSSITAATFNGVPYPLSFVLTSAGSAAVTDEDKGRLYIIGGSSQSTFNFTGTVSNGWYCFLKNGAKVNGYTNITITVNGGVVFGTDTLFAVPNDGGIPTIQTGNSPWTVLLKNSNGIFAMF